MFTERTSVGLDVHARSVAAAGVDTVEAATWPWRERIGGAFTHPGFPFSLVAVADRLVVPADMVGGRGDRPALPAKGVDVHVFLPSDHEERVSFEQLVSGQRPPASKETRPRWPSHTGGESQ